MSNVITYGGPTCPAGIHKAECSEIEDHGTVETEYGPKHKVSIKWKAQAGPVNETFEVTRRYTWSVHEKATLRKDLDNWIGPLTPEQLAKGVDLDELVGKIAQVQVVHVVKGDRTFANVDGVTRDPDDTPVARKKKTGGSSPELKADDIPF